MSEPVEQAHDLELGAPCVSAEDLLALTQRSWGRALRQAGAQPDICVVADERGAPVIWAQVRDAAAPPAPCPPPADRGHPGAQIRADSCEAEVDKARLVVDEAMRGGLAGAGGAKSAPLLRAAGGYGLPTGKAAGPGASVDLSGVIPVYDGARQALGAELNAWHGAAWGARGGPVLQRTELGAGFHARFQQHVQLISPEAALLLAWVTSSYGGERAKDEPGLADNLSGTGRVGLRLDWGAPVSLGIAARARTAPSVRISTLTDPVFSLQFAVYVEGEGS
jgi:hypothetical protein